MQGLKKKQCSLGDLTGMWENVSRTLMYPYITHVCTRMSQTNLYPYITHTNDVQYRTILTLNNNQENLLQPRTSNNAPIVMSHPSLDRGKSLALHLPEGIVGSPATSQQGVPTWLALTAGRADTYSKCQLQATQTMSYLQLYSPPSQRLP